MSGSGSIAGGILGDRFDVDLAFRFSSPARFTRGNAAFIARDRPRDVGKHSVNALLLPPSQVSF